MTTSLKILRAVFPWRGRGPAGVVCVLVLGLPCGSFGGDIPADAIARTQAATVIIRTPRGGGSGFLVRLDGGTYIVTNQHVLMGAPAPNVQITFSDGTPAQPTGAEIAAGNTDLVRLKFDSKRSPLSCADSEPVAGASVAAIGNSLDAGVITVNSGKIIGVGPKEVETDCGFVPGNSGGPLVDVSGRVIGVPTYIRFGETERATEGTRYTKDRRFSTRLREGATWVPVSDWAQYAKAGAIILDAGNVLEEVGTAAYAISTDSDISRLSPKRKLIAAAISDYQRLAAKRAKMVGQRVTDMELRRNNETLATTYRVTFQKLRDAAGPPLRDLTALHIPPEWGWLATRRAETLDALGKLYDVLEQQTKSRPRFLTF